MTETSEARAYALGAMLSAELYVSIMLAPENILEHMRNTTQEGFLVDFLDAVENRSQTLTMAVLNSGRTEDMAAWSTQEILDLILVHSEKIKRMLAEGLRQGFYIVLPTNPRAKEVFMQLMEEGW